MGVGTSPEVVHSMMDTRVEHTCRMGGMMDSLDGLSMSCSLFVVRSTHVGPDGAEQLGVVVVGG